LGRYADAVPVLEDAVALDLKISKARILLSESLTALGREAEALDVLLSALNRRNGKQAGLAVRAARLLIHFKRHEEARQWLDCGLAEQPEDPKMRALRQSLVDIV
jgi:thioredoxin-like negative regulator of GroEL